MSKKTDKKHRRYEITDIQWMKIRQYFPPQKIGGRGRPPRDNREILNGILWILSSGASWRDLPEYYGPWETVYGKFRKWINDGIFDNIFRILSSDAELENISIDGSIVKAHQHSAGAKKGGSQMKSVTVEEETVPKSMQQ